MPKLKPGTIWPTPEEEAINAGITADPDTYELTDEEFARLKPMPLHRGRPPAAAIKVHTGIRLDAEVLDAFKAGGRGWQTRINDALKDWLKTHSAA
jgi:uncharacterized protein (DUF4415 family)